MSSKTLDNLIKSGKIQGYDDERYLGHGYIVYLHNGKQWSLDPTSHTRGFDTVNEAIIEITNHVSDYPDDPDLKQNTKTTKDTKKMITYSIFWNDNFKIYTYIANNSWLHNEYMKNDKLICEKKSCSSALDTCNYLQSEYEKAMSK